MKYTEDSDQMAWLHSDDRLELRSSCLLALLRAFGGQLDASGIPLHSPSDIYGACHDYISHGNKDSQGIVDFYLTNKEAYAK